MRVILDTYRMFVVVAALCIAVMCWFLFCALLGLWPEEVMERVKLWINGNR